MVRLERDLKRLMCAEKCTVAGKKTISHGGATLWANVEQQFKDKSHNAFS